MSGTHAQRQFVLVLHVATELAVQIGRRPHWRGRQTPEASSVLVPISGVAGGVGDGDGDEDAQPTASKAADNARARRDMVLSFMPPS